jgi:hypothetical protein
MLGKITMETLALPGRILYLAANEASIRAQLAGRRLARAEAGALRDDVSTDEITPVPILTHYDDKLGRYPYTGLSVGGARPIGVDAIRAGGFSVTVAGKRYGKGSSREHSPAAERLAGIRLVVAESFERIYRQNADNIGLFTSTDFGLLDRIEGGEAIAVDELVQGRDALAGGDPEERRPAALRPALDARRAAGGRGTRSRRRRAPCSRRSSRAMRSRPSSRRPIRSPAKARSFVPTGASSTSTTPACARTCSMRPSARRSPCRSRPASSPSRTTPRTSPRARRTSAAAWWPNVAAMCRAHRAFVERHQLRTHRTLTDAEAAADDGSNVAGISHAMMAEHYALPGQAGRRHRLAHAAQRRARLRRLRGRHHRHGERVRDRRGSHHRAREPAHRPRGAAARRAHRQGHRASPARAARDPRRRRRRQGVRVRRPGRPRARDRRARDPHQHDGRARRLHRASSRPTRRRCVSCASDAASRSRSSRGCAAIPALPMPT